MGSLVRKLKWKSPLKNSIIYCPSCGGSNIQLSSKLDGWLIPEQYICKDCGYKGPIVLEKEKVDEEPKSD